MRFDILNRFSYIASVWMKILLEIPIFCFIWAGLGSRSRSEPGVFGSLEPEPEPLEKKTRSRSRLEKKSGAGAAKNLAGSSALREDKKLKEIVLYLLFF